MISSFSRTIRLLLSCLWFLPFAGQAATSTHSPAVREVIVVFKTHFDIGYTDMASNVVQRYRTSMIDQALEVVRQNEALPPEQQFAWTLPGWPMHKIIEDWNGQTAVRKTGVESALKAGRFVIHALPFTTHTEVLEPEDLVRGLGYSTRLTRDAHLEYPRDAKMTDVPCHSWIIPTLLHHAGVDFLHLGCNAASASPKIPVLFWWEGADGSRVLTMYTAESYGTGLQPPADWPHQTWLALIHTGDNHGPPTPEEVRKVLDDGKKLLPGVRVRIGRLSDFSDAILREKPNLPVVRGDMPDTWIHGPMCDPAGASLARNTRPLIQVADTLGTQLRAWGVETAPASATLAQAWEQSLLYGEHTWGGALYWVSQYSGGKSLVYGDSWKQLRSEGKYRRLEESWDEHSSYIRNAAKLVQPLLQSRVQSLADSVKMPGERVVVYNPLPWARDGVINVQPPGAVSPVAFLARQVPPMGYRSYRLNEIQNVQPASPAPSLNDSTLENEFLTVEIDRQGGVIRSIRDRATRRELVDPKSPYGFGQFVYERFSRDETLRFVKDYVKISADWATNELGKPNLPSSSEVPYRALRPGGFTTRFETSGAGTAMVLSAEPREGLPAVVTRVFLPKGRPYLELELTLKEKPADPWPEAGWICLPFQVSAPSYRLGRPGSVIDPLCDVVPGANQHLYSVNTGVAIVDPAGAGAGFCSLDSPLISLGVPGCWKYAPSGEFRPSTPTAWVNLFNNQWTTNFRLWNQGTWTWRVRVWSVGKYSADSAIITPSLEARYPLLAATSAKSGGTLATHAAGLQISTPGVSVSAFGEDPDGAGLVLRLWELAGHSGPCRVQLPVGMRATSVQPADLRHRPMGSPIPVKRGAFEFAVKAFAPATFLISDPTPRK